MTIHLAVTIGATTTGVPRDGGGEVLQAQRLLHDRVVRHEEAERWASLHKRGETVAVHGAHGRVRPRRTELFA